MKFTATAGLLASVALWTTAVQAEETVVSALPEQVTAWVKNFNPFNQTTAAPSVMHFMYEPLIIFNALDGGKPIYRLATAFEYSDDLSTITVTLREGVEWSDGEAFSADDVVNSFELALNNVALDSVGMSNMLSSVEKIDDQTVQFNLSTPSSQAMYQIVRVPIVPEHIWSDIADPVTFTNPDPVGSGPLTEIRRFTPQEYIQCRNDNYWDAESLKVDCMRFPQIANNDQALAAAANGELDWMGSFLPDIENTFVAKDPEHHRYWLPGGSLVAFYMNFEAPDAGDSAAFNNVDFRRAVSMSFDREAMVEIAGYGYPTINQYPSGLGRAFHSWNNPEVEDKFGGFTQYDVEGARALLAEAGFEDTDGDGFVETPAGEQIDIEVIVPNGWTDWVNSSQIAVEGLNAAGIKANVSTPESAIWTEKLIKGDYDMAINSVRVGATPFNQYLDSLHEINQAKSRFAASRYYNEELSGLLDAFTQTSDTEKQMAIMADVQKIVGEEMPLAYVFNNPRWYQYNTKRFTGFFSAENPVANPVAHKTNPARLMHLLALRPVE
ncbi:ABC transporter substrate-binding protein [Tritonibacter scottomollicae]|uniref:Peptide/nickel transport system substrate-binding protein n=1 Tax=Tritonibacter scottomollicae TaxID=483013 RepID=A0A2T1AB13_TRISK|nr:ABC transporter substrate-binding protein [Tritonibacter scottomollicae]PRZ45752.1 peptide/nickel transport system substrate-binding protein [Tritonibacter scottomollicae]